MNPELVKKALGKVVNPHVLVNLVSRRVRQLNAGGGRVSRPMVISPANFGAADIALLEIIEDKMGFEVPDNIKPTRTAGQSRKRPQGWVNSPPAPNQAAA